MEATVFLVDDSKQWLETIQERLDLEGVRSEVFLSAPEFFARLEQNPLDEFRGCILLDLVMPDVDGDLAFRHLKQMGVRMPIAILSSHVDSKTASALLEAGAAAVITKTDKKLFEKIAALLESGAADSKNPAAD